MQNLIMEHADIRTFLKHYVSRRVTVDTQAVVRGIQPQDALMRAACTMSRTIDPRRPRRLTTEESASVNAHPTIRSLLDQRERLQRRLGRGATQHPKYQDINRKINQERQHQRHALLQDIKERWEYEQLVRDVESQLAGMEIDDAKVVAELSDTPPPIQKELVNAILAAPGVTLDEEIRRRNRAIRAVMKYCGTEEGGMRPSRAKQPHNQVAAPSKGKDDGRLDPAIVELEAAKVSVYKEKRPTIYFICLGMDLQVEDRVKSFATK